VPVIDVVIINDTDDDLALHTYATRVLRRNVVCCCEAYVAVFADTQAAPNTQCNASNTGPLPTLPLTNIRLTHACQLSSVRERCSRKFRSYCAHNPLSWRDMSHMLVPIYFINCVQARGGSSPPEHAASMIQQLYTEGVG